MYDHLSFITHQRTMHGNINSLLIYHLFSSEDGQICSLLHLLMRIRWLNFLTDYVIIYWYEKTLLKIGRAGRLLQAKIAAPIIQCEMSE